MANYHLEIKPISRKRGTSVTKRAHYITGHKLHDSYRQKSYYRNRNDVLYSTIFQPDWAPSEFHDLQQLCDQIEAAELRRDARTGREFIGSLPNELPLNEQVTIVCDFVESSFLKYSLCAIAAIHEGKNARDPSRSNPHVHIIVPTRTVGPDGFAPKKTASMTSESTSLSGVNSGRWCRTAPTNGKSWTYGSATRVLRCRAYTIGNHAVI